MVLKARASWGVPTNAQAPKSSDRADNVSIVVERGSTSQYNGSLLRPQHSLSFSDFLFFIPIQPLVWSRSATYESLKFAATGSD
jgi:hypothetical protein